MTQPIHIFTPCWGDHFKSLFVQALGSSLKWAANAKVLESSIWTICTDSQKSADDLVLAAQAIIPTCKVRVQIQPRFIEPNAPIGSLKMQCLLKSIRQCLEERTPMLISTPDFIWADGSIQNMLDESYVSEGQNLCISIAHMRVLPSFLNEMHILAGLHNSGCDLVHLALEHAHDSWSRCEIGKDPNGIYYAGLSWRFIDRKSLITVQHQMPSPFLCNFTQSDYDEFARWKGPLPPAFGEIDHNFPTKLINEGRLRYLGSSDIAFMVEITEADKNIPPLKSAKIPHDRFFRNEINLATPENHLKIQKQFISIFRY